MSLCVSRKTLPIVRKTVLQPADFRQVLNSLREGDNFVVLTTLDVLDSMHEDLNPDEIGYVLLDPSKDGQFLNTTKQTYDRLILVRLQGKPRSDDLSYSLKYDGGLLDSPDTMSLL